MVRRASEARNEMKNEKEFCLYCTYYFRALVLKSGNNTACLHQVEV